MSSQPEIAKIESNEKKTSEPRISNPKESTKQNSKPNGKEDKKKEKNAAQLKKPPNAKTEKKKVVLDVKEEEEEPEPSVPVCPKFYYFAYGTHMLASRLHEHFPTAVRVGRGRLDEYRLDFYTYCKEWGGAPATIVMSRGSCVLGAIWEMMAYDKERLDTHSGVHAGTYVAVLAPIVSIDTRETLICRTYHLTRYPSCDLRCAPITMVPEDRKPSRTYLKTIIRGAMETGLDEAFVEWLRRYYTNGVELLQIELELDLDDLELITVYR